MMAAMTAVPSTFCRSPSPMHPPRVSIQCECVPSPPAISSNYQSLSRSHTNVNFCTRSTTHCIVTTKCALRDRGSPPRRGFSATRRATSFVTGVDSRAGRCRAADLMPPSSLPPPLPTPPPQPEEEIAPGGGPGGSLKRWVQLSGWLFTFGFGLGAPLDGFHSLVRLQIYDKGAFTLGGEPYGLHTNFWVFPLLGAFYSVVGILQLLLDRHLAKPGQVAEGSWTRMLTTLMVLVGLLRLSAQLFEDEMPYHLIFVILGVCAHGNWFAFDRTWWGYLLALLVACVAPVSEVVVMRYFDLWHYTAPDLVFGEEGIVSWTTWCYFFYTPFVGSLARCLKGYVLPTQPVELLDPKKLKS